MKILEIILEQLLQKINDLDILADYKKITSKSSNVNKCAWNVACSKGETSFWINGLSILTSQALYTMLMTHSTTIDVEMLVTELEKQDDLVKLEQKVLQMCSKAINALR